MSTLLDMEDEQKQVQEMVVRLANVFNFLPVFCRLLASTVVQSNHPSPRSSRVHLGILMCQIQMCKR